MSLLFFHLLDGREIGFHRDHVSYIEPHASGTGTLVQIGSAQHSREMHVRKGYDEVKAEITEDSTARAAREFLAGNGS